MVYDQSDTSKSPVAIKYLNNSTDISKEFIHELKQTLHCSSYSHGQRTTYFIQPLGVTIDPTTGNYGIVTRYRGHGNLRSYLKSQQDIGLSSFAKINIIDIFAEGLSQIHADNILHYDLHSGNALVANNKDGYIVISISDLGLSGPANRSLSDGKIHGVLPYLAPEVLRGNPYTEKADIYSLGMLTWETLTGKQPFSHCSHDALLAQRICNGERPSIPAEIPHFFQEFICKCWNPDPLQRPSAQDLHLAMYEMQKINFELAKIYKVRWDEIELMPKFPNVTTTSQHSGAVYTSRSFTVEELSDKTVN